METERRLLIAAAVVECLAGTALLLFPAVAVALLLDAEAGSAGLMIARVGGVALLALGVACAGAATEIARPARTWAVMAITIYNAGAGLLLVAFAVRGMAYGPVVWIAGIFHLGLASAFAAAGVRNVQEITHRPA